MISLTILELLYLVLIFFITIIGTLVIVVLFRVLKILRVWTELADFYFKIKEILGYASYIPDIIKEKISHILSKEEILEEEKELR